MLGFDEKKQLQINTMFFAVKTLALFFCAAPLFLFFFGDDTSDALANVNLGGIVISLVIMGIITFMWVFMDGKRSRLNLAAVLEMAMQFSVCLVSVLVSGGASSYYKFIFIFLVVAYTMEWGGEVGFVLAGCSSLTLFCLDLLCTANSQGINVYFQADLALAAIFFAVAWVLGFYVRVQGEYIKTLQEYANVDGLTGLFNHRYFYEMLQKKMNESLAAGESLSLVMLDIDYFKYYNDAYGHQQGDDVLRIMAQLLQESTPEGGFICRYGGEEFALVVPKYTGTEAVALAEELRHKIDSYAFPGEDRLPGHSLTVSLGVAEMRDSDDTIREFVARADSALYRAKFLRRNRVETYISIFDQFREKGAENKKSIDSVKSLLTLINMRDSYTYGHTERVVMFCRIFGEYVKLSDEKQQLLLYAAYLHDLGKIDVDKEALISDVPLTPEQWEDIKKHPVTSADLISRMDGLEAVAPIARQHHERWDGTGYPDRLKGEEIHPLARMLSIADSFDAMTALRPYKKTKTWEEAMDELQRCSGTQFDPSLVEPFIAAMNQV